MASVIIAQIIIFVNISLAGMVVFSDKAVFVVAILTRGE